MKAIGYVRVSTEKQADFGVSLGYRMAADGLHLEADPAEQGILSRIRELKAAGHTTRQIANELKTELERLLKESTRGNEAGTRKEEGAIAWRFTNAVTCGGSNSRGRANCFARARNKVTSELQNRLSLRGRRN